MSSSASNTNNFLPGSNSQYFNSLKYQNSYKPYGVSGSYSSTPSNSYSNTSSSSSSGFDSQSYYVPKLEGTLTVNRKDFGLRQS